MCLICRLGKHSYRLKTLLFGCFDQSLIKTSAVRAEMACCRKCKNDAPSVTPPINILQYKRRTQSNTLVRWRLLAPIIANERSYNHESNNDNSNICRNFDLSFDSIFLCAFHYCLHRTSSELTFNDGW